MAKRKPSKSFCTGATCIGRSHAGDTGSLICQDAFYCSELYPIMAGADGHGDSRRHFLSDRGAKAAVKLAVTMLEKQMTEWEVEKTGLPGIRNYLCKEFPTRFHEAWIDVVKADLEENRLSPFDLRELSEEERTEICDKPTMPFGTTLQMCCAGSGPDENGEYLWFLKVGDGRMGWIADGEWNSPFPEVDEKDSGPHTDSLCSDSPNFLTHWIEPSSGSKLPSSVLISTDGPVGATGHRGFPELVTNCFEYLEQHGRKKFSRALIETTKSCAARSPYDDSTLVVLKRK